MFLHLASRTDASATDPVGAGPVTTSPDRQTLIIVSTVLGCAAFIVVIVVIYFIATRRKRQLAEEFNAACIRTPGLTWEAYARRTKLSQSRIMLEEEQLRSTIISKSLQTRALVTVTPISPPARTRSRTWHARSSSQPNNNEEGEALLMSLRGDWTEHEARVEKTWQLLHKKYPTRRVVLPVEEESGGPLRPPTIRLKTPPLLSHPMFRGWHGDSPAKHSSLPTELDKIKPTQI
ncbi:hypothetical protein CCHL11_02364 [Colletotrichum chlorophyti]|uniref:Uncharacterized protein n=1 Tax=Colletotrichum chlorophyti TaxID=708187 RepID=A0A1Q8S5L2_9PEZI|nr:hypothetical protein CCHL11_02364 [Colletotrichum chlorophyti]